MPKAIQLSVDKRNERYEFKTPRPYRNSYELNMWLSSQPSGRKCYLSFSGGKDSVAAWLHMKELGCWNEIVPVYYYMIPGLGFIEEMLTYYENFFQTKIIRLPSPNTIGEWANGYLLTPMTYRAYISMYKYLYPYEFDDIDKWVRDDYKDSKCWIATGMRMYDGVQRYGAIKQTGGIREKEKKFSPIFDWKIADIVGCISHFKCKLPPDYHVWGKSFDGTDYRFLLPLKKQWPEDYDRLKKYFPLLDLNILRYRTDKMPLIIDNPEKYM